MAEEAETTHVPEEAGWRRVHAQAEELRQNGQHVAAELKEALTAFPEARYWYDEEVGGPHPWMSLADVLDRCADGLFAVAKAIRGLQPRP